MIEKTGVAPLELIKSKFPTMEVLLKPKAIIECYQQIPCNPCETSCPTHAITIGEDINQIPIIDFDKCTGCSICARVCPGLAISIVMIKDSKVFFKIPYELLPLPSKGEKWTCVNREGIVLDELCLIENVQISKDKTALITVSLKDKYLYHFSTIRSKYE